MPTINECTKNFLFHCRYEKNLSTKTLRAYAIDLSQFTLFLVRNHNDIDTVLIDKTILKEYIKIVSQTSKPKTIKRKLATLKAFFNFIEFEDVITVNPFRKIRIKIKEGDTLPKTISLHKIKRITSVRLRSDQTRQTS